MGERSAEAANFIRQLWDYIQYFWTSQMLSKLDDFNQRLNKNTRLFWWNMVRFLSPIVFNPTFSVLPFLCLTLSVQKRWRTFRWLFQRMLRGVLNLHATTTTNITTTNIAATAFIASNIKAKGTEVKILENAERKVEVA